MMLASVTRASSFRHRFAPTVFQLSSSIRSYDASIRPVRPHSTKSDEWPIKRVRSTFIDYFSSKHSHTYYPSSPLVPLNDNTLLFANAGMNQFKSVFTESCDPLSPLAALTRAVNSQKCIRAGGKHNDLDDVGKDTYHHTFFEMLGTWSFGDYFKKEAIDWAFDLLVNVYGLPRERLYASYFRGDEAMGIPCDDEAKEHWLRHLPPERVLPFDKKANFWEMGDTGPCGPCTEIHFDRIGGRDASALVNADDPDVIEIWNLVFIQYDRLADGNLKQLPRKHVDTGMGLERLTSILQNCRSNYDTDAFTPILKKISEIYKVDPYKGLVGTKDVEQGNRDLAYRVLADHIRTLSFAIADGAYPSNEGRGYVIRRILRRAIKYARQTLAGTGTAADAAAIGETDSVPQFSQLVSIVVQHMADAYPELKANEKTIVGVIEEEELSFSQLLAKGIKHVDALTSEHTTSKVISGSAAFYLYGSLGFPIDLTQLLAAEKGWSVDVEGFNQEMNAERERGRASQKRKQTSGETALANIVLSPNDIAELRATSVAATDDRAKYASSGELRDCRIRAAFAMSPTSQDHKDPMGPPQRVSGTWVNSNNSSEHPIGAMCVGLILDKSSFYAESGGQVWDTGSIEVQADDGSLQSLHVYNVQSFGGYVLHSCIVSEQAIAAGLSFDGAIVHCKVDQQRRKRIAPNHTFTHILNCILRRVLGDVVEQRGSLVAEDKLRFDFSYGKSLTSSQLREIEELVNAFIRSERNVTTSLLPMSQALAIPGVRTLAGEAYPDPVRVVQVENGDASYPTSVEFCGGTHITNTREAIAFAILEEGSVAKGIRRVTAVTGEAAQLAITNGAAQIAKVEELTRQTELVQQSGVHDNITAVEAALASAMSELNDCIMPLAIKIEARLALENATKIIIRYKKALVIERFDLAAKRALEEAESMIAGAKAGIAIVRVPPAADSKQLQTFLKNLVVKTNSALSIVVLSEDEENKSVQLCASVSNGHAAEGISTIAILNTILCGHGARELKASSNASIATLKGRIMGNDSLLKLLKNVK